MNERSFLNFDFTPIELNHSGILEEFLKQYPQPLSGYTVATLTAWCPTYHYEWVFAEPETLLISCVPYPATERHLLQPVGSFAPELQQKIVAAADTMQYPLKMVNVSNRFLKQNPEILKFFGAAENRSFSNYLYRSEELAVLHGRKYSKKRNLLSQAFKQYEWVCSPLTESDTGACFQVLDSIEKEEEPLIEGMLEQEIAALKYTLTHFRELRQQGLLITIDGTPVAFSIFEAISPTTVTVHFERALRRFKGLYQVINWETSKVIAEQGCDFINREEDLGDIGLRKAKKSYHPIKLVPAFELTYRPQTA
jgi:hypothetical protein